MKFLIAQEILLGIFSDFCVFSTFHGKTIKKNLDVFQFWIYGFSFDFCRIRVCVEFLWIIFVLLSHKMAFDFVFTGVYST